jgi:hypothetical protein
VNRQTIAWLAAALLGIAATAAIAWTASQLAVQHIGLSSEPLSVASGLAPAQPAGPPARPRHRGESAPETATVTAPSTTTVTVPATPPATVMPAAPPAAAPAAPVSSPPAPSATAATAPATNAPPSNPHGGGDDSGSGSGGGGSGNSRSHRDD